MLVIEAASEVFYVNAVIGSCLIEVLLDIIYNNRCLKVSSYQAKVFYRVVVSYCTVFSSQQMFYGFSFVDLLNEIISIVQTRSGVQH